MAIHNNTPICIVKDNLGLFEANKESNQEFALYNINSQNDTRNKTLEKIFKEYPDIQEKILNSKQLVVSLTSFPGRIGTVNQTIDSILNQKYQNIEVIAIDDGSTDNSYSVIRDYAEKEKKVKCFSQHSQPLLASSSEEYIQSCALKDNLCHLFPIEN